MNPKSAPRKSKKKNGKVEKPRPIPPVMPPAGKAPWINIQTETYGNDWKIMINNPLYSDVTFKLKDRIIHSHKIHLCSASSLFR